MTRHLVSLLLAASLLVPASAGANDGIEAAISLLEQSLKDGSLAKLAPSRGKRVLLTSGFKETGGVTRAEVPIMKDSSRGFTKVGTETVLARGKKISDNGQKRWHTGRNAKLDVVRNRLGMLGLQLRVVDHYQMHTPFANGNTVTGIPSKRQRTLWLPTVPGGRLTKIARRRLQRYLPGLSTAPIQTALQTGRDGAQGLSALDREVNKRAAKRALNGHEVTLATTNGRPMQRMLGGLLSLPYRREDHRLSVKVVKGKPRFVLSTHVTLSNFKDSHNPMGLRTKSYTKPERLISRQQLPQILARHNMRLSPGQVRSALRGARLEMARNRKPGLLRRK